MIKTIWKKEIKFIRTFFYTESFHVKRALVNNRELKNKNNLLLYRHFDKNSTFSSCASYGFQWFDTINKYKMVLLEMVMTYDVIMLWRMYLPVSLSNRACLSLFDFTNTLRMDFTGTDFIRSSDCCLRWSLYLPVSLFIRACFSLADFTIMLSPTRGVSISPTHVISISPVRVVWFHWHSFIDFTSMCCRHFSTRVNVYSVKRLVYLLTCCPNAFMRFIFSFVHLWFW